MTIIRDKMAKNAREGVEQSVYRGDGATGFDAMPSFPERSADVRSAEQYERGNLPGVNVYTGRKK